LHLWPTAKPPGLNDQPIFGDFYSIQDHVSAFTFSPDGRQAAACAPDGSLYTWPVGSTIRQNKPIAHLRDRIGLAFSQSGDSLYAVDAGGVYFGGTGEDLSTVTITPEQVQSVAVMPDSTRLAIFMRRQVIVATRRRLLFGIPLWARQWPALVKPLTLDSSS
jgi:hypothetical protein